MYRTNYKPLTKSYKAWTLHANISLTCRTDGIACDLRKQWESSTCTIYMCMYAYMDENWDDVIISTHIIGV